MACKPECAAGLQRHVQAPDPARWWNWSNGRQHRSRMVDSRGERILRAQ